jgi:hypothetical protein
VKEATKGMEVEDRGPEGGSQICLAEQKLSSWNRQGKPEELEGNGSNLPGTGKGPGKKKDMNNTTAYLYILYVGQASILTQFVREDEMCEWVRVGDCEVILSTPHKAKR